MKECIVCKLTKPLEDFSKPSWKGVYIHPRCKICQKIYDHERYLKYKDKSAIKVKLYKLNNKEKIKKERKLRKAKAINYKGGMCIKCGYFKDFNTMHFHHLDPKTKSNTISQLITRTYNWDEVVKELDKCVLLCANCHSEEHNKFNDLYQSVEYTIE